MRASILLSIVSLLLLPSLLHAQRENNIWYFGNRVGIDFNGPTPMPLRNGAMLAYGPSSVISDPTTGELLFYTNGETVWNSSHMPMTNGTGLLGNQEQSQGTLIVPMPGAPSRYYVFTNDGAGNNFLNGFRYSVVDVQANGGVGTVLLKNELLLSPGSEKVCGIRQCDGVGYWVITHARDTNAFYAFDLTQRGIDSPVVSYAGTSYNGRAGSIKGYWYLDGLGGDLKASHDGKRLATVIGNNINGGIYYDFDSSILAIKRFAKVQSECVLGV